MVKVWSLFSTTILIFDIHNGSTIEVTELLDKGLADFGLLVAPVDLHKYDYLALPIEETFGLLMRKDNPLAELETIPPKDIKDQSFIVSRQQLDGNVMSSWLEDDVSNLNIVSTFNLIITPAMLVEAGLGSAITSDKLVKTSNDSELTFRPLAPKITTNLYLVWKKYQLFPRPAKLFLEQVKSDIKKRLG